MPEIYSNRGMEYLKANNYITKEEAGNLFGVQSAGGGNMTKRH
jgi:hypothetical protein